MVSRAQEIFNELTPSEDGNDNWRQLTLKDLEYHLDGATLAERERCAGVARRWAADVMQHPDARLVAAYIEREINDPR